MEPRFYYHDLIFLGDLESNIALTTLWTRKEEILRHLDKEGIAIAGQLYSKTQGVNALIRNCLLNKNIRYLFVTGKDLSGSGEAIINFFEQGIDPERRIRGIQNALVDEEIDIEAIERLRQNVKVLDRRYLSDYKKLRNEISSLKKLPPYGKPEYFADTKPSPPTKLPSEKSGFRIEAAGVGEAWLQALKIVQDFGVLKKSQYYDDQKEILNLIVVINGEDPDTPHWKEYYEFTPDDLNSYYPKVLTKEAAEGIEYTYGQRLRDHRGIDQIKSIVDKLKRCKYTRRAIAFTWDVEKDHNNPKSPCLDLVQAVVQDESIHLTAYLRSNDIYGAWPMNTYALRKLQKTIAQETELSMGYLTTISCSAHIYESNWTKCKEILEGYYRRVSSTDPRGNFIINLSSNRIVVRHVDAHGNNLYETTNTNASAIMQSIHKEMKISDTYHCMYLGSELQKAETALRLGLDYTQDEQLHHPNLRYTL